MIVSFEIQGAGVQRQSNEKHIIVLTLFALCRMRVHYGRANSVKIDNLALVIVVFVYMLLEHHVYSASSYLNVRRRRQMSVSWRHNVTVAISH